MLLDDDQISARISPGMAVAARRWPTPSEGISPRPPGETSDLGDGKLVFAWPERRSICWPN